MKPVSAQVIIEKLWIPQSHRVVTMPSLLDRLKKIQEPVNDQPEDLPGYSLQQLEEMVVDFGSTHVGRTYLEMWEGHQSWIRWFVQHYSKSTKRSHRLMIHFIQAKIERHELTGAKVPLTDGDNQKPVAKSKARGYVKPMPKTATTSTRSIPQDVMDELDETWEELDPELLDHSESDRDPTAARCSSEPYVAHGECIADHSASSAATGSTGEVNRSPEWHWLHAGDPDIVMNDVIWNPRLNFQRVIG